jgi:hypothetical protein
MPNNSSLHLAAHSAAASLLLILPGCAGLMPEAPSLPSPVAVQTDVTGGFIESEGLPITTVALPRSVFVAMPIDATVDGAFADIPLDLQFRRGAQLFELVEVLGSLNIPVVIDNDAGMEALLNAPVPFVTFRGTVGELLNSLRRSSSVLASQRAGAIHLGTLARFSVDLPQNADIIEAVAAELTALGATDVVQSMTAAQVIYRAQADVNERVIQPYLERVASNLSMVTMQIAVVSIQINDDTRQGFDWNRFRLGVQSGAGALPNLPFADPDTGAAREGDIFDLGFGGAAVAQTAEGSLFGRAITYTVGGALNFLSTFGQARINQNVEVRTIAGKPVRVRSGQAVPFVTGVSTTSTGDGGAVGSVETSTVQTGLTLDITPYFDAASGLVTFELNIEQKQIIRFVDLSAGTQLGSFTQPLVQDQTLNDTVRIPAGQTVMVGGLQSDNVDTQRAEPSILRWLFRGREDLLFGSRNRLTDRSAYFVIVRPAVTVFRRSS